MDFFLWIIVSYKMTSILNYDSKTVIEFYTLFTSYHNATKQEDRAKKFYELLTYANNNLSSTILRTIINQEIEDPIAQTITFYSIKNIAQKN